MTETRAVPAAIREYLVKLIGVHWGGRYREDLPTESTGYTYPPGCPPHELERIKAACYEHNNTVQALLQH